MRLRFRLNLKYERMIFVLRKKILGRTGLEVGELSVGGLFLSDYGGGYEMSKKALLKALDCGCNYIDTAPGYFNSEEVLGNILTGCQKPLIFSTKLGGRPQPFDPKNKEGLLFSVKESLRLLKRDHIDILFIHEPDRPMQYDWWTDSDQYDGPVMEVLDQLKKEGLVKFIGLGGTTTHELARICDTGKFDCVLTASNYSLLWQEARYEVIPAAKRHNMGIVSGSPLQQGALSQRYDDLIEHGAPWLSLPRREQYRALYKLLDETGMPIVEMCMRFIISNPDISCVLTGARSEEEFLGNLHAIEKGPLPQDILDEIERIYQMVPFRPSLEPFSMPFLKPYQGAGELV